MSPTYAELIFVAGPQDGQRSLLSASVLVLGRSISCDVHINEQAVSREQARLTLTTDGWVIENLSSTPLRINGKKYKPKKRIILDTDDILGLGVATEMLFVAAGDDSDAVLGEYRLAHPVQIEPQEQPAPAEGDAESSSSLIADNDAPSAVTPQALAETPANAHQAEATEVDEREKARKAKVRNYIIFGGIYAVVMVFVIFMLTQLNNGDDITTRTNQRRTNLSPDDISVAIEAPLEGITRHPSEAAAALRSAKRYYDGWIDNPGDLYRCVKHFKLYQAYKGDKVFESTADERMFGRAKMLLTDRVNKAYRAAWVHENQKDWRSAYDLFSKIQSMLPVHEEPGAEKDHVVFRNVLNHISYIRKNRQETKRR